MPFFSTEPQALPVRSRIYRCLYELDSFCTKQELARRCNISKPTLYQHLSALMDEGLVRYSGEEKSTGGRKAQGVEIVPDARFAVGISVAENHLRFAAADLRLNKLAYMKLPFVPNVQAQLAVESIASALEIFLNENALDRARLLGVGVALPGIISSDGEWIEFSPTFHLKDMPIAGLSSAIPYRVHNANDASSSGHAEWFLHGGRQNMAFLSLENGVGGAVLIGGAPYDGDHRRSGEFGHICVEPGGLPCNCGKSGCLEAYCSARRISDDLGITLKEFFQSVEQHDPERETLWFDVLRHLAAGINSIHMALDCDVVLGGFLSEYLQPYLPILKRYVLAGNPFETNAEFVQLSTLRKHTVPLGAALHFVREFIENV